MANKINAGIGNIENCYGLLIDITDTKSFIESIADADMVQLVEVCVVLDGERKDFTLQEFKTRLGFLNYK